MGKEEGEFLKERAKEFLENAEDLLKKGVLALAAFNLEQAAQLYLKYFLFLKLGDYPKTHFLKELLEDIGKVYRREEKTKKFWEKRIEVIRSLENAYLTSRYYAVRFEKIEVENMLKFVKELVSFLKSL